MADAITTILRSTGEAPDPALRRCHLAHGFARLILCLAALQRAEAQVFETSLADPDHEARLTEAEALWAEFSDRLALLAYPPMEPGPAAVPVVWAARLMVGWLAARSTYADRIGAPWLARAAARLLPPGESRLAWQTGALIRHALSLFAAVTGLDEVDPQNWASPGEVEAALPALAWPALPHASVAFPGRSGAIAVFPGAFRAGVAM